MMMMLSISEVELRGSNATTVRPPVTEFGLSRMSLSISPGSESFALFSCLVNGEERDQSHRAVYR